MFYFLSKILDVLVTPIAWATALVVTGVARRAPTRRGRVLALLGVAVLVVFSLEPVSNALFRSLESEPLRTFRPGVTYDTVILLGGITDERAEATWGERAFNDNNERLLQTFDLLRTGAARTAIVSGGAASATIPPKLYEARVLVDQLVAWGIDPPRLVVEDKARNTHENAVFTAAIVRDRGWQSVLVVTSAFHMPRAYGCFRAEGLAVDTLPVDFRSYESHGPVDPFPRADHLAESSAAIREWVGRAVYRVRGYSR
ncbi:MAG: YdcF family protein [Polyangiaceae bacterium]